MKLKKEVKTFIFIIIIVLISIPTYKILTKEKAPTKEVEKKEEVKEKRTEAKLTFVGDLLFESPYYDAINSGENKDLYFSKVNKFFKNDDLTIGNMEVVIGNDSLKISGTGYNFCAPSWVGDLISNQSFEVLSTANNHAFDQKSAGVISTLNHFKNTNIKTIGTFESKSDRNKLNIIDVNGIKIGFLAYTMSTNVKPNQDEEYMISYYKSPHSNIITENDYQKLKEDIEKLKDNTDLIIVLMHWGKEFTYEIDDTQENLANFFNANGVDIIVGSHAHNIQPIKWINKENKTLVYYGMGNFVSADDDIPRTTEEFNNAYQVGLLSEVIIEKEGNQVNIKQIETEPIINYYDKNLRNFTLIPFQEYTEEYEKTHLRYTKNFNRDFINKLYTKIIDEEFR